MNPSSRTRYSSGSSVIAIVVHVAALALFVGFVLESEVLSTAFFSEFLRSEIVKGLGGEISRTLADSQVAIPWATLFTCSALAAALINCSIQTRLRLRGGSDRNTFPTTIVRNALWSLPILIWDLLWILSALIPAIAHLLIALVNLACAVSVAGWIWEAMRNGRHDAVRPDIETKSSSVSIRFLVLGMTIYVMVYVTMNWGLWFNLRIPHGDSAMYEEHLWNLWHGKGFRSDLDQGLFWGEHIQCVHLLLSPLYLLWPSHLLLELCESFALSSAAIPVFLIAKRQSGRASDAILMATAYLLYFPMHYLDIAIDFKTFRPIAFGIPLLLWAINAMEQQKWRTMFIFFVLALTAKEDYAIVIAPLGLWLAVSQFKGLRQNEATSSRTGVTIGVLTCLLATVYLLFVVKIAIPYFRNWETVHYVRYFEGFGSTPTEIAWNILTRPALLWSQLLTVGALMYFLQLLLPVGMPLRGWPRLLVGLPLFVLLCLNKIAMLPPGPYHHFHAPIIPIIFWAACGALGNAQQPGVAKTRAQWILACAIVTTVLFSHCPLGIKFWDPGSEFNWKRAYIPDERARQFEKVIQQIPLDAKVASTDYVHAHMTHYGTSYDYSQYPRRVANYEDRVPNDTEYIIIDRRHKYSIGVYDDLRRLRELNQQPSDWELLPDQTNGYFAILKRKTKP